MKYITSRDNPLIKHIIKLEKRSYREKSRQYIVEGKRLAEEAFFCAKNAVSAIVASESYGAAPSSSYVVPDKLFAELCHTDTPQGILCVMDMPIPAQIDYAAASKLLILDGISEPGNMGTIIRTSEAVGADAVILLKGCTDAFSPKAVRSTMGSIFRQKLVAMDSAEELNTLKQNGFTLAAASLDGENMYSVHSPGKLAIIIGSEPHGVSTEVAALAVKLIKIPMAGGVESLNAAASAAVMAYRFWGQNLTSD